MAERKIIKGNIGRVIEFRFWDKDLKKMIYKKPYYNSFSHRNIVPQQCTGFIDSEATWIYEGDILSDIVQTDEGEIQSKQQVYWNEEEGQWYLDNPFKQDKSNGSPLHAELSQFRFKITGNIFEK